MFVLMAIDRFNYTSATWKKFARSDLERAVTREFRAECGTHIVTRPPGLPAVVLKVGTPDDPGQFGTLQMAIFAIDKQACRQIHEGLRCFEQPPQRQRASRTAPVVPTANLFDRIGPIGRRLGMVSF